MNDIRHTPAHVAQWQQQGFVLIDDFFSFDEIAPIIADYEQIYGKRGEGDGNLLDKKINGFDATHAKQFKNIHTLPYEGSVQMNLISLHPALIEFAKSLLAVPEVSLYQSHTWAKYTGEADYDQAFHCDFHNHTLTVPAEQASLRTVDFILYLTDVSEAHGAMQYVRKQDSENILGPKPLTIAPQYQDALKSTAQTAIAKKGALLAHGIDTIHRGTNLTLQDGYRFTMTIGYKARGNEMIGFHVWQWAGHKPWDRVIHNANEAQLACLGIPLPGDPFWTTHTLQACQARWPEWDMSAYFAALDKSTV